jgi:hypothetical protein
MLLQIAAIAHALYPYTSIIAAKTNWKVKKSIPSEEIQAKNRLVQKRVSHPRHVTHG